MSSTVLGHVVRLLQLHHAVQCCHCPDVSTRQHDDGVGVQVQVAVGPVWVEDVRLLCAQL